ncbi:DUF4231 domain-containing protein [Sphingomonas sp. GCM10030256]|uniref:DUF4231 domain-containing protein n=1 Tax=Sphingomonas sp. GCM10030256 TaxID=3273427 RepID=UPI00360A109F
MPRLRASLAGSLDLLRSRALALLQAEADWFEDAEPRFTLVSPLASGVDQIAARAALDAGWELQAVLPLRRGDYRALQDTDSARELDALLAAATCVLELPGDADDPLDAYVMAGRATVAHADLLVAVWDGLPARGRGGTAQTVETALLRGTPILHLPVDQAEPRLLWSALDPAVITHTGNHRGSPATSDLVGRVLASLLAPPRSEIERRFYGRFLSERPYSLRWRIEYPLLMTLAGAHRLSRSDLLARPGVDAMRTEWQSYRDQCVGCHGVKAEIDWLEEAYAWADRLATHFAQAYRSSHIFNFLLAATGALIGLSGLVTEIDPTAAAVAEFLIIVAVVANTLWGSRRCWHQRWLDYRQLAERLRPMRSLKLLGIAAPDPPGSTAEPIASRWVDWYAGSVWRSAGCPSGQLTPERARTLAEAIAARELDPQIAYHRRSAAQSRRFDERLETVALTLFSCTILVSLAVIVGLQVVPDLVAAHSGAITFLSAGLPAVGTAIFGIRVQGDYGNVAARSGNTAILLERVSAELGAGASLDRAADLTEQAARIMFQDLDQWRLVAELHELSVG